MDMDPGDDDDYRPSFLKRDLSEREYALRAQRKRN